MAVFGVYIEKEVPYFGQPRIMGNTYHYETEAGQVFDDQAVAEEVAAAEAVVTWADVQFLRWVTWGPTDGASFDNVMREDGRLDFPGEAFSSSTTYGEICSLVTFPMPRSPSTNRKRWLRKFLRLGLTNQALTAAQIAARDPLPQAALDDLAAYGRRVGIVTQGTTTGDVFLCSDSGDRPNLNAAGNAVAVEPRQFTFTRQIGQ